MGQDDLCRSAQAQRVNGACVIEFIAGDCVPCTEQRREERKVGVPARTKEGHRTVMKHSETLLERSMEGTVSGDQSS